MRWRGIYVGVSCFASAAALLSPNSVCLHRGAQAGAWSRKRPFSSRVVEPRSSSSCDAERRRRHPAVMVAAHGVFGPWWLKGLRTGSCGVVRVSAPVLAATSVDGRAAHRLGGPVLGRAWRALALAGGAWAAFGRIARAHMPSVATHSAAELGPMSTEALLSRLALWFFLFIFSASFHAAEIAITTLYPWKVKEFAEEEGEKSPFRILNKDITRVLTTILVASTCSTIYGAALFTNLAIQVFGAKGLAYSTAVLTAVTLFFGELLPKALGVNNAEMVARAMVPAINLLAVFLSPLGKAFSYSSKLLLALAGFQSSEDGRVSEEELRLIVTGAKQSGGIEREEGSMIEGVLNLQDTKVSEIMCPRVEVVAVEANATMAELYRVVEETKYSRIPVYAGEIDRIVGMVLSKELLDFIIDPKQLDKARVSEHMEATYFVPEAMSVGNVLEEMRKRRLHMAVVVDEYGGTAGIVTLEDILEEVVGEIYDEEDDDAPEEEQHMTVNDDGSFMIQGTADLEDVCTSLNLRDVGDSDLKEFGTVSGYLCSQAGEIPAVGDYILAGNYMFTVTQADERRIVEVNAKQIEKFVAEGGSEELVKAAEPVALEPTPAA